MIAAECHHAWRHLPEATLDAITGSGTALVLAPHPDDESLGCGGLIATCTAAYRPPLVVILTDGAGSHPHSRTFPADRLRQTRAQEAHAAVAHLGLTADRLIFLNQPDTKAPHHGADFEVLVARLLSLIRQHPDCTAILAPWRHDPHCDHEAASLLAARASTAARIAHVAYPVWGWTLPPETAIPGPSTAGLRLGIAPHLAAKRAAIHAHQSQYGDLITDDPTGFRLPPDLLSVFDTPFETFLFP